MVQARRIADVLGGMPVLRRRVATLAELNRVVEEGLPKMSLASTVRHVFSNSSEQRRMIYRVVPEATYKRRRDRLSPSESERTERLARIVATAEYVWGDPDDARLFLTTPHPALNGKPPLESALTELGARQVEELLAKIFYGLAA